MQQAAVVECSDAAAQFERALEIKLDREMLDTLVSKHNVKTTKINQAEFRSKVTPAVLPLVQKYGLTQLVKDIEGVGK